jgi:hypothetical protein
VTRDVTSVTGNPGLDGPSGPEPHRTPEQEELLEELRKNDMGGRHLARVYEGHLAALVLQHPERLVMAAHQMREFVEAAPHIVRADWKTTGRGARDHLLKRVRDMEKEWSRLAPGGAPNQVSCVELSGSAEEFFVWLREDFPSRKQGPLEMVRKLRPEAPELPDHADRLFADDWCEHQEYFEGVSHHRIGTSDDEFSTRVTLVTRLLLDRMRPKHVAAVVEIERVIAEHE